MNQKSEQDFNIICAYICGNLLNIEAEVSIMEDGRELLQKFTTSLELIHFFEKASQNSVMEQLLPEFRNKDAQTPYDSSFVVNKY